MDPAGQGLYPKSSQYLSAVALNLSIALPLSEIAEDKKIVWLSFGMSLSIEVTQILLDLLINANRVFEIDDLWTNTWVVIWLGGLFSLVKKSGKIAKATLSR